MLVLKPDGTPETAFNGTGRTTTDIGGSEVASAVAVDAQGRIVVVGTRDDDGVIEVVITEDVVLGRSEPIVVLSEGARKKEA